MIARLGGGPSIQLRYEDIYEILWFPEQCVTRFSLKGEWRIVFLGGVYYIHLTKEAFQNI